MAGSHIFFDLSVRNVRLNFLRSLLASLGIVIGVVAISAMGMLGANMQLILTARLSQNVNIVSVSPISGGEFGGGSVSSTNNYISDIQVQQIKQVVGHNIVIPLHTGSDTIMIGSNKGRASIIGIDPSDVSYLVTVAEGTDLSGTTGALVGATLANDSNLNLGSRIKIGSNEVPVMVVGILNATGFGTGLNADRAILVPDHWYTSIYGNNGEYNTVNVIVNNINDLSSIRDAIDKRLNRNTNVVRISDPTSMLQNIQQSLGTMTSFLTMLGGISLLVAAVSIFNVMMMSVSERIREIGILRSIGTKKGEVRRMFLYEAFILGAVGAGIGGLLSFIIGYLVVGLLIGNITYFFMPQSLVYLPYGMAIGIIICVLAGIYPAWKASNLNPIEALRHE